MVNKPRYDIPQTGRHNLGTRIGDNCWFAYIYRDASNYKKQGRIPLRGSLHGIPTEQYAEILREHALHDFDQFCAEDMGLDVLYPWVDQVRRFDESEDDFWHEVDDFYPSKELVTDKQIRTFAGAEHVLSFIHRFVRRATLYGWSSNARQSAFMGWTNDYIDPEARPTRCRFDFTTT